MRMKIGLESVFREISHQCRSPLNMPMQLARTEYDGRLVENNRVTDAAISLRFQFDTALVYPAQLGMSVDR